jgi:ABC-2 type transport system ATP-binding protein
VCDEVAILSRGSSVAAGPVSEVLSRGRAAGMIVEIADPDAAVAALQRGGLSAAVIAGVVQVEIDPALGARVSEVLAHAGLYPRQLRPHAVDLETVFMELTEREPETVS